MGDEEEREGRVDPSRPDDEVLAILRLDAEAEGGDEIGGEAARRIDAVGRRRAELRAEEAATLRNLEESGEVWDNLRRAELRAEEAAVVEGRTRQLRVESPGIAQAIGRQP